MAPLKIAFMGTAPLACPSLCALCDEGGVEVSLVVTQPDKPKGRHLSVEPSAVKRVALDRSIPVLQPHRARDEGFLHQLADHNLDLVIVVAYGQLLPGKLLQLPKHGCLNVHTSLLPKYRGAAPIQWAILDGEQETGVTIMKMDPGLDTGPILSTQRTPILSADTAITLHDRLAEIGAALLVRTIPEYVAGRISPRPQPAEGATYARKIHKADGLIDWAQPAEAVWNRIRGLTPWPGAYTHFPSPSGDKLLKLSSATVMSDCSGSPGTVLRAGGEGLLVACGSQGICVSGLQLEGGRWMSVPQFMAGHSLPIGLILGTLRSKRDAN